MRITNYCSEMVHAALVLLSGGALSSAIEHLCVLLGINTMLVDKPCVVDLVLSSSAIDRIIALSGSYSI